MRRLKHSRALEDVAVGTVGRGREVDLFQVRGELQDAADAVRGGALDGLRAAFLVEDAEDAEVDGEVRVGGVVVRVAWEMPLGGAEGVVEDGLGQGSVPRAAAGDHGEGALVGDVADDESSDFGWKCLHHRRQGGAGRGGAGARRSI
jgi:hypothetical protein